MKKFISVVILKMREPDLPYINNSECYARLTQCGQLIKSGALFLSWNSWKVSSGKDCPTHAVLFNRWNY